MFGILNDALFLYHEPKFRCEFSPFALACFPSSSSVWAKEHPSCAFSLLHLASASSKSFNDVGLSKEDGHYFRFLFHFLVNVSLSYISSGRTSEAYKQVGPAFTNIIILKNPFPKTLIVFHHDFDVSRRHLGDEWLFLRRIPCHSPQVSSCQRRKEPKQSKIHQARFVPRIGQQVLQRNMEDSRRLRFAVV